jgi:hypothetical protein
MVTSFFEFDQSAGTATESGEATTRFAPDGMSPDLGLCRECQDLAHAWSEPNEEVLEVSGERFVIWRYRCVCQCCCVAVLATSRPYSAALSGAQPTTSSLG